MGSSSIRFAKEDGISKSSSSVSMRCTTEVAANEEEEEVQAQRVEMHEQQNAGDVLLVLPLLLLRKGAIGASATTMVHKRETTARS